MKPEAPSQVAHTAGGCWAPCLLLLLVGPLLGLLGAWGSHLLACCLLLLLLLLPWLLVLVLARCLHQLGCQSPVESLQQGTTLA
jgi:hypothetical protein